MNYKEIILKLESLSNQKNREGMARFGINTKAALGISIYTLRDIAKGIPKNHELALRLWDSGIHEARHLASQVDEPEKVTEEQFDSWVADFNSWDICDQVCSNLLDKTPFAYKKVFELAKKEAEFEKRTAFTLMACLSVHNKDLKDSDFERFFPLIKREAVDERNYVKKAVNWALRQIGKRNKNLNKKAIEVAKEISKMDSRSAKWIASDALRELQSEPVQKRMGD
ncbi:MAG: DNA alkylation repair protein [Candidatus Woykebacteria bacterium RBG_13_40_15]|uniref:DNA alkylation repair protein n=1 Tax=Candidatus Woykebacteria bacterium RBG_13_40_15 TaxID=1802593 RepID=A0A1G1W5Z6_9BACT|nr:MAG: DNA alkylation repair protein [Candidatus Woykebacteria bacterium RBG_13_40_15]